MLAAYAFRNVVRAPRRWLAVFASVAVGVWSLLFLGAFNHGGLERLRDVTIHTRFAHGQVALRGYFRETYEKPTDHWIAAGHDVAARLAQIPGVAATFPRVSFPALVTSGRVSIGAIGQGGDAERESSFFTELNVEEGELLTSEPDGVMLGHGLARALDVKPGDPITILGTTVHGTTNATQLVVRGVFHTGNPALDERSFRMQLVTAQAFLDTDRVESVALGLSQDRDDAWLPVAHAVAAQMPELEATSYAVLDEVNYVHTRDWLASQSGVFRAIVMLLVFFGVLNSVAAGVLDRRAEVGNLRANGESRIDVLRLLSLEALLVALAGAIAGVGLHIAVAHGLLAQGISLPPPGGHTRPLLVVLTTNARAVLEVGATVVLVAVLGALLASVRVVRTPVAVALRST